jgi:uncharacterized protein (DUF58 family)
VLSRDQQLSARILTLIVFLGILAIIGRLTTVIIALAFGVTVVIISGLVRHVLAKHVTYWRKFVPARAFEGETFELWRNIANQSWLPALSVRVEDKLPKGLEILARNDLEQDYNDDIEDRPDAEKPDPSDKAEEHQPVRWIDASDKFAVGISHMLALLPHEKISLGLQLQAKKRGYYVFDPHTVRITDVLGLFDTVYAFDSAETVIVYPRVFDVQDLPLVSREPFGVLNALRTLVEDPLRVIGARDYAYGDSFRQIDWKSTARRGKLQTRVFERASEPAVVVMLNVATGVRLWEGTDLVLFEWAVRVAASFAKWAHESGWAVGLSTNGNAPHIGQMPRLRPRRAPDQLTRVLENLAAIGPYFMSGLEEFVFSEQRFLPPTATQVIVTCIMSPQIEEALGRLRASGKPIVLVCLECRAPNIEGVLAFEMQVPKVPQE